MVDQERYQDERLVQYLLGELPVAEQEEIDARFAQDDELFEQMLAVEEDLIDNYVRGKLSRAQHRRFEQHFLQNPARRQRVSRAKSFLTAVQTARTAAAETAQAREDEREPWWKSWFGFLTMGSLIPAYSMGAAALLLLLGGSWLFVRNQQMQTQIAQAQQTQETLQQRERELLQQLAAQQGQREELNTDLQKTRAQLRQTEAEKTALQQREQELQKKLVNTNSGSQTAPFGSSTLLLTTLLNTRGPASEFIVHKNTDLIRINISLEPRSQTKYRASLRTLTGEEVFAQSGLQPQGQTITVTLAAAALAAGDYLVTLSGRTAAGNWEDVKSWPVRIIRR